MYEMNDITDILNELESYRNGTTSTITLTIFFLTIFAMWRIFEKAGVAGWKSIIPIYNVYTLCKIVKLNFWLFLIACILLIIPVVNFFALIYIIYFYFAINFRLSRAFGHDFLFGLGLVLFNTIFILILGFNEDKYKKSNI